MSSGCDELEKLFSSIITQGDEENSNYEKLYKNRGRVGSQEERRREMLRVQKSNRLNILDKVRGIIDNIKQDENTVFNTNYTRYRPNIYVAGFTKVSSTYKDVLMFSEWIIEKPEDFEELWYCVPCPKGVRMLVVASQGITKCYSKYGQFKFECRTALPGGNPCDNFKNKCCVLDCFYDENSNTMFMLDILAWNNQPMTDGETEFRRFWLENSVKDLPELQDVSKKNKIIFSLLPMVSCKKESLDQFLSSYPVFKDNEPNLDGLLFYHKNAQYVAGKTPLVGWLYPFMVQEILDPVANINPAFMAEKPSDYVNQADFIQKFDAQYEKKRMSRRSLPMDTAALDADAIQSEENEEHPTAGTKDPSNDVMESDDTPEKNIEIVNNVT